MKKLLITFITLICLILPVLAGNNLQIKDETMFKSSFKMELNLVQKYGKEFLFREDYYGYQSGKDSMYGAIVYEIDTLKKSNLSNKYISLKYLYKLKYIIDIIITLNDNSYESFQKKTNLLNERINISDDDYINLTDTTKILINSFNCIVMEN